MESRPDPERTWGGASALQWDPSAGAGTEGRGSGQGPGSSSALISMALVLMLWLRQTALTPEAWSAGLVPQAPSVPALPQVRGKVCDRGEQAVSLGGRRVIHPLIQRVPGCLVTGLGLVPLGIPVQLCHPGKDSSLQEKL